MGEMKKIYGLLRKGPLLRGTREWEDRELARQAMGCRCLSFGTVAEARQRERRQPTYYN